ncbi:PhzF family phenazine biosynthesis protein [Roseimarinus sediminis]|uniref:PhzF family phenazine biosynthesis protein n=1 Tax=Roseimarinus sediminis TaxID=1610899 RepID=UPI003D1BD54C
MNEVKLYQIDAFAETPFSGNPAAVVILDQWPEKQTMQNIAMENNLSETAFLVSDADGYAIRYFTPLTEVELCGHATLASAYVLFNILNDPKPLLTFTTTNRGQLFVSRKNEIIELDFPCDQIEKTVAGEEVISAIGLRPIEAYKGISDLMLVYNNEEQIRNISPDFSLLKKINLRGIIITAPGMDCDFVSRFFAPHEGIDEDPVTGSAHTTLIPYWHMQLGKTKMTAKQLSKRGGTLYCEYAGKRVKIGGKALHYLTGTISV